MILIGVLMNCCRIINLHLLAVTVIGLTACRCRVCRWIEEVEALGPTDHLAEDDAVAFDHLVRVEVEVDFTAEGKRQLWCCTNRC